MEQKVECKGLSRVAIFGIVASCLWIIYIVGETVVNFEMYKSLKLNELGDFLAGAGGPVVLLWIVIGYFQQSAALRLQQQELRNQVEETKNLVQQSTRQVDLIAEQNAYKKQLDIRKSHPHFTMQRGSTGPGGTDCLFRNHSATVTEVEIWCDAILQTPFRQELWAESEEHIVLMLSESAPGKELRINYIDSSGIAHYLNYIVTAKYTLNPDWSNPGSMYDQLHAQMD